jgi:hypothetical protein
VRALNVVAVSAFLASAIWFLHNLAQRQLSAYLRDDAAHALALDASGETPYRWRFRDSEDIIAGRVFGAEEFSFDDDGLRVASPGRAFEIGLPLARPVDLRRFPRLRIDAVSDTTSHVRVVVRQRLEDPEVMTAPAALGANPGALDLSALAWEPARPATAAMVRLRFDLPRGQRLRLRGVTLQRLDGARRIDLMHIASAPVVGWPVDANAVIQSARDVGVDSTPVFLLAHSGTVDQRMLALRQIREAVPAAFVIPEEAQASTFEQARQQATVAPSTSEGPIRWSAAAILVLSLVLMRLRPPRNARVRALLELTLLLAVPLWLVAAGHFTGRIDHLQALLIVTTAIYAISLGVPRTWTWNGSAYAWLLAGAVVALTVAIGVVLHGSSLRDVGSGHVIRYLGWALIQQYLICALCVERWRIVTGSATFAACLSALAFALLHTPNATLMLATFAGGLCWCALYLRERALLPLAFSHAASALLLIALLPPEILISAEVSARFFQ